MRNKSIFIVSLLAGIAILAGAGIYYLYYIPVNYVGIDINPSVELSVNRMGRVIDALPLNDEADILLSDLDLSNMPSEDAVEKIVQSSTDMGYIDELAEDNAIEVSVSGEDNDETTDMEKSINDKLEKFLTKKNIPALILLEKDNEERRAQATVYGISNGKMLLIQKAVTLDPTLVESELATKSVQEIAKLIKASRKEIIEAKKEAKQQQLIQQKEQIKATFQNNYREKIKGIIKDSKKANENLTETEKSQIVQDAKEQMRKTIQDAQSEIKDDWSNVDNSNTTKVPTKIKDKINNMRNRWTKSQK